MPLCQVRSDELEKPALQVSGVTLHVLFRLPLWRHYQVRSFPPMSLVGVHDGIGENMHEADKHSECPSFVPRGLAHLCWIILANELNS